MTYPPIYTPDRRTYIGDELRIPSPPELGLPDKFGSWRSDQLGALEHSLDCPTRFSAHNCPTGFGKSLWYMGHAANTQSRTIFLTSTKGLQDQLLDDFSSIGLVDIRGKNSYQCQCNPSHSCEEGSAGKCHYKGTVMCPHSAATFAAKSEKLVVSNYSCWIAANKYGQGWGQFDLMVCDEAHNIPDELAKAMQVKLSDNEISEMLNRPWPESRERSDMTCWKRWAGVMRVRADMHLQEIKAEIERTKNPGPKLLKDFTHYRNLARKLADLALCKPEEWVVDEWQHGWQFDPVNPARYGERILYRGIPRVMLTSATVMPKTVRTSGINTTDRDLFSYYEYASAFAPGRSPIYLIPTAKMGRNSSPSDYQYWLRRADQIIVGRMDRKGLFHTVSFKNRDYVMENSDFHDYMYSNFKEFGDVTGAVVSRYKSVEPPAILVSPSITTGYDFPAELCRYQIIGKIPFPDERSKVAQARKELDKEYGLAQAMQTFVQACGRGNRSVKDWQEVFVIDDNAKWFLFNYRHLAPKWFHAFIKPVNAIPPAMEI